MESIDTAFRDLDEARRWFTRVQDLRVLHVFIRDSALREGALALVLSSEHLADQRSIWVRSNAPADGSDASWETRTTEIEAQWEALQEEAPELHLRRKLLLPRSVSPVARFAAALRAMRDGLPAPIDGLVVVLAPELSAGATRWEAWRPLLDAPELRKIRWVVAELIDDGAVATATRSLGPAVERVTVALDPQAFARELERSVEQMAKTPPDSEGPRAMGAPGPDALPPSRQKPPPLSPEQREEVASAAGIAPAWLDPSFTHQLRVLVSRAIVAQRQGRPTEAIQAQSEACERAWTAGLGRSAVLLELVLGGYVFQAGQPEAAERVFAQAAEHAQVCNAPTELVQAQMSLASMLLVRQETTRAIAAYLEAAKRAADEKSTAILATECYRMAGQLLAGQGALREATQAFEKAIAAIREEPVALQGISSAPEAARQLAALCRKNGLRDQAVALEAQATAMEQGTSAAMHGPDALVEASGEG